MPSATVLRILLLGRAPGEPPRAPWLGGGRTVILLAAAAAVGIAARLLASTQGHNYDIESYWIVSDIVADGGNVYAETRRYNYGPAWFLALGAIRPLAELFGDPFAAQRILVAGLLTVVDLAVAAMLLRRFGAIAAALFLLHPVSILITGYHSQFDNLAIALGLAAMLLLERASADRRLTWPWLAGIGVLGVSLVVKHILLVLPLWLAMRHPTPARAATVLLVPPAILVASFLPWIGEGGAGIMANVVDYRSFDNAPFLTWIMPPIVARLITPTLLLGAALLAVGWLVRHRPPAELLLVYTVTIVAFAPAIANQYLAIPAAATAVLPNLGSVAYAAVTAVFLAADPSNLEIAWLAEALPGNLVRRETDDLPYAHLVALLAAGLAIMLVELRRVRGDRREDPT